MYDLFYGNSLTFFLLMASMFIVMLASFYFNSVLKKNLKVESQSKKTGLEVANQILMSHNITDVKIFNSGKRSSNYFDPTKKQIILEENIYNGTSIAALAVAAHEVGHAIQYHEGYKIMTVRNKLIPFFGLANKAGYVAIFIGIIFGLTNIGMLGIYLLLFMLLFQLMTLPIEFDASKRALRILESDTILYDNAENAAAAKVLKAAALTYIAGFVATILQILRLFAMLNRR